MLKNKSKMIFLGIVKQRLILILGTTMTITPAPSSVLQPPNLDEEVIASSTPNDTINNIIQDTVSSTAAQMAEDLAAAISATIRGNETVTATSNNQPPVIEDNPNPVSEEQALPPPPPPPYLMPQEPSMRIIINPGAVSSDEDNEEASLPGKCPSNRRSSVVEQHSLMMQEVPGSNLTEAKNFFINCGCTLFY